MLKGGLSTPLGILALAAASAIPLNGSAAAGTFVDFYQGVVGSGIDTLGVFGPKGADLSGTTYTEHFFIRSGVGLSTVTPATGGYHYGGSEYGTPRVVFGTLRIGSKTVSTGLYYGFVFNEPFSYQGIAEISNLAKDISSHDNGVVSTTMTQEIGAGVVSFTHELQGWNYQAITYHTGIGSDPFGGGYFLENDTRTNDASQIARNFSERINLSPSFMVASALIPEPGAWALMLVGVAGLGAAVRGRRRAPAG
jgi:hypothetical protein